MACDISKYVGKDVAVDYVIACGDVLPLEADWKSLGSMRAKELSGEWDTTDATDDSSVGGIREMLATFMSVTVSGDGVLKKVGGENLTELTKHFFNPVETSGQPTLWLRMTFPDLTFKAYFLLSSFGRNAQYDDVAQYSLEAQTTASPFGVIVEDTPNPDAIAVASVSAFPVTLDLDINAEAQLVAAVSPVGAPTTLQWSSSAPTVASVTQQGIVKGLLAGSATITVRSTVDNTKTDTVDVTVS